MKKLFWSLVFGLVLGLSFVAEKPALADWGRSTGGAIGSVACALTGCTMTGVILGPDGTANAPAYAFSSDSTIGMWKVTSSRLGLGGHTANDIDINTSTRAIFTVDAWTFSGVTTDVSTGTNEDFTIAPNGTGKVVLTANVLNFGGSLVHTNAPTSVTSGTCTAESLATGGSEWTGTITATCTAQTWIIAYTTTYGRAPNCTVIPLNAAAVADVGTVYATSTTALTATITTATTAGQWAYTCVE